jgi:hydroxyacid-oxoacid transhydrogenase
MLGQDNRRRVRAAGRNALPSALVDIMRDVGIPNGLNAVGYSEADLDSLVAGTMKQQRLLTVSPRPVTEDAIAAICLESMVNW